MLPGCGCRLGFLCRRRAVARAADAALAGIGGAIALLGELLRIWAAGHLEKGREVTQSGPYRLTRHPLYPGSAIIAVGAAVAAARASAAILIGDLCGVTIVSAIRHEEADMRASFGDRTTPIWSRARALWIAVQPDPRDQEQGAPPSRAWCSWRRFLR